MKIKFKSTIFQNENENQIEFTAPVEVVNDGEFEILSFNEPSKNVANRIEISQQRINIFAGPTTIYLILDKNQTALNLFELMTPEGVGRELEFYTQVIDYKFENLKEYFFEYELFQKVNNDKLVMGNFKITLTIEN